MVLSSMCAGRVNILYVHSSRSHLDRQAHQGTKPTHGGVAASPAAAQSAGPLCQNRGCMRGVTRSDSKFCGRGCCPGGERHVGLKGPSDPGYAVPQSPPSGAVQGAPQLSGRLRCLGGFAKQTKTISIIADSQGNLCQNVGCMSPASSGYDYCGLGCKPGGARHRGVKAQGDPGYAPRHAAPSFGHTTAAPGATADIARKTFIQSYLEQHDHFLSLLRAMRQHRVHSQLL